MKIEIETTTQVLFQDAAGTRELAASTGDAPTGDAPTGDAPTGDAPSIEELPLIVTGAQRVLCGGKVFDLNQPGLYRFSVAPQMLQNVIVHDPNSLSPLLRSLASLQIHGNHHEDKSDEWLLSALRNDACISVTCGTIARIGRKLLEQQGFGCRFVAGLTMEKWNTYDNGHTMLEILWPENGWVLVDLDMGFLFQERAKLLSLYEVRQCLQSGRRPEMINLADFRVDPFFYMNEYNFAPLCQWSWSSEEAIWKWYGRTLQSISVLDEGNGYIFFGPHARIREYYGEHTEVLDEGSWLQKFYP